MSSHIARPFGCPRHLRPPPQLQQGYDSRLQLQRLQRSPQLHRCAYPPRWRSARCRCDVRTRSGRRGVQGGDQEQDPKGGRLAQPRCHGTSSKRCRSRHVIHCHHGPQQQDIYRVGPLERQSQKRPSSVRLYRYDPPNLGKPASRTGDPTSAPGSQRTGRALPGLDVQEFLSGLREQRSRSNSRSSSPA
ncbi:hypothetical protein BJY59DRAFT_391836 [Rhodotorula toruloides]